LRIPHDFLDHLNRPLAPERQAHGLDHEVSDVEHLARALHLPVIRQ
jgi:hypothetical protein